MQFTETRFFLPFIVLLCVLTFFFLDFAPSYTQWALIFLVLPSVFFLFRAESTIDFKKVAVLSFLGIVLGLLWDHAAMSLNIWNFPNENVLGWFLGIPLEEYVFAICFPIIVVGIYTSLPRFKMKLTYFLHLNELPLIVTVSFVQIFVLLWIFFGEAQSYIKWLLLLAILPSFFWIWRKGEKIDELRMTITSGILVFVTLVTDVVFIKSGSWFHYDEALIGKIGIVPIDDILFSVFIGISLVGLYTSLPKKNMLNGTW